MRVFSREKPLGKIVVNNSAISGKGSFATRSIMKGEFITILKGQPVRTDEYPALCQQLGLSLDDPLQIQTNLFLILEPKSKAINHSCEPNVCLRDESSVYALRNIKQGEEITYDYSTTVGLNEDWQMQCCCGSSQCRHLIENIGTLPKPVLDRYVRENALPRFILLDHLERIERFDGMNHVALRGARL